MESSNSTDAKRFQWAQTKSGWKDKSGKIIPFTEMTESQLNKFHKLAQHKELMYLNKSYVFSDKCTEMEEEAEKRGITLNSIDTEFHSKRKAFKDVD